MDWAEAGTAAKLRVGRLGLRFCAATVWRRERPVILMLATTALLGMAATSWLVGAVRADIASGLQMPALPDRAEPDSPPLPVPDLPPAATGREAYFPSNGSVVWNDSSDDFAGYESYGEEPTELLLADDTHGYNHVLRFYRNTAGGSRLLASLHLGEGGRARIRLPRGAYAVELVSRSVDADYDRAFGPRARGRFLRVVDLTQPASRYRLGPMLLITGPRTTMYMPGVRAARHA